MVERGHSSDNMFHHNVFRSNNGGKNQAQDNALRNKWNSESEGNYWSDWAGPDSDGDGIVDEPYLIDGTAGSMDNYPLAEPVDPALPVANGGLPVSVDENTTVRFDARNSHDDKGIVNYTWEFDYKGEEIALHGPNPAFTFEESGVYDVLLTVMDDDGNVDTDTICVTVGDVPSDGLDDAGDAGKPDGNEVRLMVYYGIGIGVVIAVLICVTVVRIRRRKKKKRIITKNTARFKGPD